MNYKDKGFKLEGSRTAVVGRVSSNEQKLHGLSIPAQREVLYDFIEKNNMVFVEEYFDEGYSGANIKRPALQRLLKDVKAGKIDLIIFTKLDRWTRNMRHYHKIQEILERHNVQWKAILEDYDTFTANGQFQIHMVISFSELERARTSERIDMVNQYKFKRKEILTGSCPIGYKIENRKMVVDDDTKHIAQFVFDKYEELQSVSAVTYALSDKGIPLQLKTIRKMLMNRKYIGEYTHKTYGTCEDYFEALISKEQFERVNRLLKINRAKFSKKAEDEFIFRKLLVCGKCGKKLTGGSRQLTYARKSFYRCQLSKGKIHEHDHRGTCDFKLNIYENNLEEKLLLEVNKQLQELKFKVEEEHKTEIPVDKVKLNRKLKNLKMLFMEDEISEVEFREKSNAIKEQLTIKSEERLTDISSIERILDYEFKNIYHTMNNLEKRRLWSGIIKDITIHNKHDFTINFFK